MSLDPTLAMDSRRTLVGYAVDAAPGASRWRSVACRSLWLALITACCAVLLSGCATAPSAARSESTPAAFDDTTFAQDRFEPSIAAVLEATPQMREFVTEKLPRQVRRYGAVKALVMALNEPSQLGLKYDASLTRTAAQTFESRTGNCLSMALVTASLADLMGLEVDIQRVLVPEIPVEAGDVGQYLQMVSHVNLRLSERTASRLRQWTTVDFLLPPNAEAARVMSISRERLLAMYFNNKAVEALLEGATSKAYWWTRASIKTDPGFASAHITLGAIWTREGRQPLALASLQRAVALDPGNPNAEANLTLAGQGASAVPQAAKLPASGSLALTTDAQLRGHLLTLIKRQDWPGATALLRSAEVRGSDRETAWLKAVVSLGKGERETALQELHTALGRANDPATVAYLQRKISSLADPHASSALP